MSVQSTANQRRLKQLHYSYSPSIIDVTTMSSSGSSDSSESSTPDDKISTGTDCFRKLMPEEEEERCITVKFRSHNEFVFTQAYYENTLIGELKHILHDVFNVPPYAIELRRNGVLAEDHLRLSDLEAGAFRILELDISSSNAKHQFSGECLYEDYIVPDVITVRIYDEDGQYRETVVEIVHKEVTKPFLGGYINIKSQIEYHHAYSQTGPLQPKLLPDQITNRDTQTYWYRNRKPETTYSRATQMANSSIWIPNVCDKVITSRKYETAEELEKRKNIPGKVKIIQRYFRAWKIRRALKEISREYQKRIEKETEEDDYKLKEDNDRKKRELIGKVFPRSKADFSMLYSMLDRWKKAELSRIVSMACGPSKIAEMYLLLEKEIQMLLSIENHRKTISEDMKIRKIEEFFKAIGDPIEWNSKYHDLPCSMDTIETQKGREYHQLYLEIADKHKSREGRIEALLSLKLTLENHNCDVGMELVDLIDRECNLLTRGLSDKHLENLRKRIEALFLKHIQMPECSHGVTNRMNRVKEKLMENNLFYCNRCKSLKTHEEFLLHSRTESLKVCKKCSFSDRVLEPWIDIAPYRFILRWIRREERLKCSSSSVAFILQEKDIEHIITKIWHSHSAISECSDIYQLRLCRFFKDEDWAPWNCILLTNEEAKEHLRIPKLDEVYDGELLGHVYNKHLLAKAHFANALQLEKYYQEIGKVDTRWNEIIELKKMVAVNSSPTVFLSCH